MLDVLLAVIMQGILHIGYDLAGLTYISFYGKRCCRINFHNE